MITIDAFTFTYPGSVLPALQDIRLRIEPGEAVLIRGASGSGKSTLLYCMNGLIPHVFNGVSSGSVRVDGFSPSETPLREMARTVGTVFQNPESQIFMMRVEDDVAFGCENLLLPREEIIQRRDDALRAMKLWDHRDRETFKLSGGQKQRLAISSIYAMGPRIFLFDEPTTDLDSQGRREFFQILKGLKAEGKTLVLVEHQYEDYLPLMDSVLTLKNGRIADGDHLSNGGRILNREIPLQGDIVIEMRGIGFGYGRDRHILKDLDLSIRRGEIVALRGENGSGKTTLLKILAGILRPGRGTAVILGRSGPDLPSLVGRVGFLFQNPDEQLFAGTVEEELVFGPSMLGRKVAVDNYLCAAGLLPLRTRHPQTLSRGQRQILAVTAIMAMEPDILILDEPTTGLDSAGWHELFFLLYKYAGRGGTVIFSTHNAQAAFAAQRCIMLQNGRIANDEIS
jgi:energy-coupling factor transporter ATP-binding protein EcfA2